jgi:hypothetical protein
MSLTRAVARAAAVLVRAKLLKVGRKMGDSARLCLFCLEKRTNRQKIFCVENLFGCECKVYCHAKCIKKWHHFCGDDLQCAICRNSIVEDDVIQVVDHRGEIIKNILVLLIRIILVFASWYYFPFTWRPPS